MLQISGLDVSSVADNAKDRLRQMLEGAKLDAEQWLLVDRAVNVLTVAAVATPYASPAQQQEMLMGVQDAIATLANIGAEQAVKVERAIRQAVLQGVTVAIQAGLKMIAPLVVA